MEKPDSSAKKKSKWKLDTTSAVWVSLFLGLIVVSLLYYAYLEKGEQEEVFVQIQKENARMRKEKTDLETKLSQAENLSVDSKINALLSLIEDMEKELEKMKETDCTPRHIPLKKKGSNRKTTV